jgi:dipeptidyl-peptidase-4
MALTCLFKAPERFRAGIAYAPVTDWRLYDTIYTERYMETPQANPEGYAASAALEFAHQLQGRLLLVHGASDNNVHLQNTLQLSERLSAAGKTFDMLVYPRVRHGIRTSRFKLVFHQRKWEFLRQHLLPESDGSPR